MKFRLIVTAVLAVLLAAPVIATSSRFTDVPPDHEYNVAIDWAYNRGLFKGYLDRTFKPNRELSENELQIVVKRLFDSYDTITRAQTAAILYYGITYLETGPPTTSTTTTTTTTRPIITTTTTTRPVIRTTTTTVPPTIVAPFSCPLPVRDIEWLSDNTFRFPIDNSRCSIPFTVYLDATQDWFTSFSVDSYASGFSRTFRWPVIGGSMRDRIEVRAVERRRGDTYYYSYYHLYRDGRRTTITTEVEGF